MAPNVGLTVLVVVGISFLIFLVVASGLFLFQKIRRRKNQPDDEVTPFPLYPMARPRHKHTDSGTSMFLYGQEVGTHSSTSSSMTSLHRMSHHDISSISPAFLDSRYPSSRRQSSIIDGDPYRRLSTFSAFEMDGTRHVSTFSIADAEGTQRQSINLVDPCGFPPTVQDSRPSLSPLVIPAGSSSGSESSHAREVEIVSMGDHFEQDSTPQSASSNYSQKSASLHAASRAPTIRVDSIQKSNSPAIEVMQVNFENRLDFQQPVIDRSNTRVIGHLLQSRAQRTSTDISRNFSQVSHIERAGSIKAVDDFGTDLFRRARNRLTAQKRGKIPNVAEVEAITEVMKTPVSVISPTNTPFTNITLTPVNEKTSAHKI